MAKIRRYGHCSILKPLLSLPVPMFSTHLPRVTWRVRMLVFACSGLINTLANAATGVTLFRPVYSNFIPLSSERAITLQANGGILIAGRDNLTDDAVVLRFRADGVIDPAFGASGAGRIPGLGRGLRAFASAPNNATYLCGTVFTSGVSFDGFAICEFDETHAARAGQTRGADTAQRGEHSLDGRRATTH